MRQILLISIVFLLLSSTWGEAAQIETAPEVGSYAPPFVLKDLEGKTVSLESLKGKVILLNFWATYCVPCKTEMPSMNALYEALKEKGFLVLAVSIDTSVKPVKSFISGKKLRFPVLLDKDKEVFFDSYAALGLPTSFLIDRKGIIVEKVVGPTEWNAPDVKDKILRLLTTK
jgi:peroxiredoxin